MPLEPPDSCTFAACTFEHPLNKILDPCKCLCGDPKLWSILTWPAPWNPVKMMGGAVPVSCFNDLYSSAATNTRSFIISFGDPSGLAWQPRTTTIGESAMSVGGYLICSTQNGEVQCPIRSVQSTLHTLIDSLWCRGNSSYHDFVLTVFHYPGQCLVDNPVFYHTWWGSPDCSL